MIGSRMRVALAVTAVAAAALFGLAAGARAADECDKITENIKAMIGKIDDKAAKTEAGKCAAMGQMLGLMRMVRIVREECMSESEERTNELAKLDGIVRGLATGADMQCR
jgi:ABC-type dipeptide/oligopeptide/nickel transport system permease subunit